MFTQLKERICKRIMKEKNTLVANILLSGAKGLQA